MKYDNIVRGEFIRRPNRFIAQVEIETEEGKREETVHVKNTGRCRELLIPKAAVYLEKSATRIGKPPMIWWRCRKENKSSIWTLMHPTKR